jgi:Large-conductance mechanosensitive channel
MDLAIGVIIGGAFKKIITSLVDDMLMPLKGTFIGISFEKMTTETDGAEIKWSLYTKSCQLSHHCVGCISDGKSNVQNEKTFRNPSSGSTNFYRCIIDGDWGCIEKIIFLQIYS